MVTQGIAWSSWLQNNQTCRRVPSLRRVPKLWSDLLKKLLSWPHILQANTMLCHSPRGPTTPIPDQYSPERVRAPPIAVLPRQPEHKDGRVTAMPPSHTVLDCSSLRVYSAHGPVPDTGYTEGNVINNWWALLILCLGSLPCAGSSLTNIKCFWLIHTLQ